MYKPSVGSNSRSNQISLLRQYRPCTGERCRLRSSHSQQVKRNRINPNYYAYFFPISLSTEKVCMAGGHAIILLLLSVYMDVHRSRAALHFCEEPIEGQIKPDGQD